MDLGISGRVALVTASSKGLGLASAEALAAEGVRVLLCARGAEALRAAKERVEAAAVDAGHEAEVETMVVDVTDPAVPAMLVQRTVDRFGAVHILVANAGGPPPGRALDVDDAAIRAAVEANLLTTVRLIRESVPHMRSAGWGRICAITSNAVKQPIPTLALSNTARTGLWAWAKTAAPDLVTDGITLNLACPGLHLTDRLKDRGVDPTRTPVGDPRDFGQVVAFLCSEQAGFVSGVALQVDGAATVGLL